MKHLFWQYLFPSGLILALLYYSCANPVPPTGGAKDTTPPKIDSLKSTPNLSTHFKEKTIKLTFDEWVTLTDAFNQVVVSPPLEKRPNIEMKGKTLVFEFDKEEKLKENTTYIINFGNSIKDLREGNIPPNLKFIFSTGPAIDSLEAKGLVVDLETGKAEKDVLVMFYEDTSDSIVRKEKPYYFAKTNDKGAFNVEYMKAGQYKVFALVDNNFNYLFDLPNEKIGFMDSLVTLTDSTTLSLNFKMFEEEQTLIITDEITRKRGFAKLAFNKEINDLDVRLSDSFSDDAFYELSKDSLFIWYSDVDTSLVMNIFISLPRENFLDTVSFKMPQKENKIGLAYQGPKSFTLSPLDTLFFEFSTPIQNIDTSKIKITLDSLPYAQNINFSVADNPRKLKIEWPREKPQKYAFELQPGAITNMYEKSFTDTINLQVTDADISEFGDLNLKVIFPDSSMSYIYRLTDSREKILDESLIANDTLFQKEYKTLTPGKYIVYVIEDSNANGRRDSGNYEEKRQPERIFKKNLEDLRKNWELEADVKVKF